MERNVKTELVECCSCHIPYWVSMETVDSWRRTKKTLLEGKAIWGRKNQTRSSSNSRVATIVDWFSTNSIRWGYRRYRDFKQGRICYFRHARGDVKFVYVRFKPLGC